MELNIVKTDHNDLDGGARCVLALINEPFFFIRYRGTLYINKGMKDIHKITEAVSTMWRYDLMDNDQIMAEMDEAYDTVKKTVGAIAADQLLKAWHEAAKESRQARAEEKARTWVYGNLLAMSDEEWDKIFTAGYDSDFVKHGLFRVFRDLYDKDHNNPAYREYFKNWSEAAFVYGYQLGKAENWKEAKEQQTNKIRTKAEQKTQDKISDAISDEAAAMAHNLESREETEAKIEFFLPMLTDAELRMVSGIIRGIRKGECRG